MKTENTAYLLLGSNIGNRKENLKTACMLINEKAGKIIVASSTYKTAPWKMKNAGEFLNLAVCIKTALQPDELLEQILYIEKKMGRERDTSGIYSSRIIDIDILLYGNLIINNINLTIPHPLMQERKFALLPLAEIAANRLHPVYKKKISTLLTECSDKGLVKRI